MIWKNHHHYDSRSLKPDTSKSSGLHPLPRQLHHGVNPRCEVLLIQPQWLW
jgi:hypothetical protein